MTKRNAEPARPASLAAVAGRVLAGQAFDPALREFLDEFYAHPDRRAQMLAGEPRRLGAIQDAYLAAVAEHLSAKFGLNCPPWVNAAHRFLDEPFFAGGLESLKAILLVESPVAFRRRMIFVGADVLSRPRAL